MTKLLRSTVYSKALAIFLVASLMLFGAVAALTQLVIMRQFNDTENSEMKVAIQRFLLMLSSDTQRTAVALQNWSQLDAIKKYVDHGVRDFPADVGPQNLKDLQVDFLAVYDRNGSLLTLIPADPQIARMLPSGEDIYKMAGGAVLQETPSLPNSSDGGFLLFGHDQLASISICRLLDPATNAASGLLVAGKIPGLHLLREFGNILSADVQFHPFTSNRADQINGDDIIELLNRNDVVVMVEGSNHVSGNHLVRGPDGKILGYFSLTQGRLLQAEGRRASSIFLIGITLAGGVLVIIVWFLLDRTILARIRDLIRRLEREKRSGKLPVKLNFQGNDELGILARSVEDLAVMLQSSRSEFSAVAEDQSEMLCRFDNELRLVFANQVFIKMFDLKDLPLSDCCLANFLPEGMREIFIANFRRLTSEEPLVKIDQEMELPSGQTLSFHSTLRAYFAEDGASQGGQWVITDMSLLVVAQRRMLESELRFRRLFETSSDGILLLEGPAMKVLGTNSSMESILNLSGHDIKGLPLTGIPIFAPCLDAVRRAYLLRRLEDAPSAFKNEFCLRRGDGSFIYVELHCNVYLAAEQEYMQLNFRDISDRIKSERELRLLSVKLLRSQDNERRRIARELHDSTAQSLSALEMNMSLLEGLVEGKTDKAIRLVEESRSIARECSQEIRNISYLLHPPLIDEVGLVFAIRWFATGFAKRTGILTHTEVANDFPRLDAEVELPLFRVVQEAMSNIYRHSGAKQAWVSLTFHDQEIELKIRDNGRGFLGLDAGQSVFASEEGIPIGVGLAGIRERLAPLGGKLHIATSPRGVTVTVSLLLSQLEHAVPY